ncbi:TPA: hypothetical protein DCR49_08095 [Candidatus Delongbacteria bacterium]|nr:hypothetical protein [Candidatus Delongbacteria bacterium]
MGKLNNMNFSVIKKDIILILRSRPALITISALLLIEAVLILYSRGIIKAESGSDISRQFSFMQNYVLIFYFPLVLVSILNLSFSLSKEMGSFLLASLIPLGESTFLRSKVYSTVILSALLTFPFLYSGIVFCGLESFQNLSFLAATSFYLLFFSISLCTFTVYYAICFFDGDSCYEPGVKGIIGMMFFVSAFVLSSFIVYSKGLSRYYNYATGFRKDYPNLEINLMIGTGFIFLIVTRIMLRIAEKKLIRE